jgi:hypothetical protein
VSDATLAAIETAIAAHVADEYDEPWLVTHWYAIACAASAVNDSVTNYVHMAPNAPVHGSLGLITLAERRLLALIDSEDE